MSLYWLLFLIFIGFSGVYYLAIKETVDTFSVAYGGAVFYFLPALLGSGDGIAGSYQINNQTYYIGILLVILLLIFDIAIPRLKIDLSHNEQYSFPDPLVARFLSVVAVGVFTVIILTTDLSQVGSAKRSINSGISANLFRFLGPLAFVALWSFRDWYFATVVGIQLVLFMIIFQVRSPLAFALLSVLLYSLYNWNSSIRGRLKTISVGASFGTLILYFDAVKGYLLRGDFSILWDFERNIRQVVWGNNAHAIFQILNRTLETEFRMNDPLTHTAINVLSLIPFSETIGLPTSKFGNIAKPILFPTYGPGGIGSNLWAEAYAIFGWVGVLLALIFFSSGIWLMNGLLNSNRPILQIYGFVLAPYWAFFGHRLAFGSLLSTAMIFMVLIGGSTCISLILVKTSRTKFA